MKMQMPQGILWRATLQRKNEKGEVLCLWRATLQRKNEKGEVL
ncbi:MAG: hypothetical protein ACYSUC_10690 [Planctomycetota bacterium]|jgi:hypothetical protein